jgi:hypothetical protein
MWHVQVKSERLARVSLYVKFDYNISAIYPPRETHRFTLSDPHAPPGENRFLLEL